MRCSTEEERGIRKRESLIITTRPSPRVAQLHSLGLARRRKSNRREETRKWTLEEEEEKEEYIYMACSIEYIEKEK
jgi:hypothetical protein